MDKLQEWMNKISVGLCSWNFHPQGVWQQSKDNFKQTCGETRRNGVRFCLREATGEAAEHSGQHYPYPAVHASSQTVIMQDSCPQRNSWSVGNGHVAGGMSFASSAKKVICFYWLCGTSRLPAHILHNWGCTQGGKSSVAYLHGFGLLTKQPGPSATNTW